MWPRTQHRGLISGMFAATETRCIMRFHTNAVAPISVMHELQVVDPPNVTLVPITGYRDGYIQSRVLTQGAKTI